MVNEVSEKVGSGYGKRLSIDWLETAFAAGDMYDEIADDVAMCLRHLKKLIKEVGMDMKFESIPKWDFYEAVRSPDLVLTIQTADQALWANLLLTVGVRTPDQ